MNQNANHPIFVKDARLREEYDDWVHAAAAPLAEIPQKRQILASIDQTNHIANNARAQAISDLDKLDAAYAKAKSGPSDKPAPQDLDKRATPQDKTYENGRADIMSRFTDVNDRLWRQRETLAQQLDTLLERQNIKRDAQRARLPTILQASKPVAARHSYLDMKQARPPVPSQHRDQDQEQE